MQKKVHLLNRKTKGEFKWNILEYSAILKKNLLLCTNGFLKKYLLTFSKLLETAKLHLQCYSQLRLSVCRFCIYCQIYMVNLTTSFAVFFIRIT